MLLSGASSGNAPAIRVACMWAFSGETSGSRPLADVVTASAWASKIGGSQVYLREGERFVYEYNFSAAWRVDLRVEQIACAQPGRAYPRCTGGRRVGPPEDWDGPWAFLERTQPHSHRRKLE